MAFQILPYKPKMKHTVVENLVDRDVVVRMCGVWIFAQEVLPIRNCRRPESLAYEFSTTVNFIVVLFALRCDTTQKLKFVGE